MKAEFEILAVNRGERIALASNDDIGDFVWYGDEDGDEVSDIADAAFVVVEWRRGKKFSPLRLSDYPENSRSH